MDTEVTNTNLTLAVVRVLTSSATPIFSSVIAAKAGLTAKKVTRIIDRLRNRKLISRKKAKAPLRYYQYFMTDEQHRQFVACTNQELMKQGNVGDKIDFLMLVRRNPMYGDNPMLRQILADYQFLTAGA